MTRLDRAVAENLKRWLFVRKNRRSVHDLAEAKLASSGLRVDDAAALGIVPLDVVDVAALSPTFKPVPAIRISYADLDGAPLRPAPRHPPFFRLRYLAAPNDFGAVVGAREPRYAQAPGTRPCAYFPRNVDWRAVTKDRALPILVTEGELKAAKASREGFPTIGLGGVSSFRSGRLGYALLPELAAVGWVARRAYVVYDSDYRTNPEVCAALNALARELRDEGALPFVVSLPSRRADVKTGLDDFLLEESADALRALIAIAEPLTIAEPLHRLNERVVFVRNPGLVLDLASSQKMSPSSFKEGPFATATYLERTLKGDGSVALKKTSAAAAWLAWPHRSEVASLTYRPGAERFVDVPGGRLFNAWPGWGVEPRRGTVAPFLRLVDHLFSGAEPASRAWFLRWAAYPLARPGTKLFTSVVLYGNRHGTGKSLLGFTLGRIYGRNFAEITSADLHASFNEWAEGRQFVLGDDVTGSDRRADADLLKKLITQKELRVNQKYVASYVVPDVINYLFTSNQPDAFFLEDDDRRFFVHEVTVPPLPEDFYAAYDVWLDSGGAAAVFDFLLKLPLDDFNPAAPALKTAAKARMIADVKSDLGAWVERLKSDPDAVLRVGAVAIGGDLFTNRALLALYDPTGASRTTANGLGREMKRSGFFQVFDGRPVRVRGVLERYYAVRNADRWRGAPLRAIVRHVEATVFAPAPRGAPGGEF
jgi:hypothetical protein